MLTRYLSFHQRRRLFSLARNVAAVVALAGVILTAPALTACGAVYPEVKTPVREAPAGGKPAPPSDVLYVVFEGAIVPAKTRDGRQWDSVGGQAPDPFARLLVDEREVILTPVQSNTLNPTWPNQKRANYRIRPGATVLVEVWDKNAVTDRPICSKRLLGIHDDVGTTIDVACPSGARVLVRVEEAHALTGLGFAYELRGAAGVHVTKVLAESPAGRAGITKGTRIWAIQGEPVGSLDELEIKSVVNKNSRSGVTLDIEASPGQRKSVTLREEAMYPLADEYLELP